MIEHGSLDHAIDEAKTMDDLPFADDAKINAVLILQRRIFQLQADYLHNAIQRQQHSKSCNNVSANSGIPSLLVRRNISDEMQSQNRTLDDVEMTLLGILDSSGMLSLCSRISEFIVVMTRVVKVEHRAICLYILSNCMTSKCGQSFITFGGLRLLKRWIKVAEEEDCVDELRIIITLCKSLPFDAQAVKDTEIGKSIRRLLKFRSNSTNIETLYTEVRNLMQHWTNHVKGVIVSESQQLEISESKDVLPDIVLELSQRLLRERGLPATISATSQYADDDNSMSSDYAFQSNGRGPLGALHVSSHDMRDDTRTPPLTPTAASSSSFHDLSRPGVLDALATGTNAASASSSNSTHSSPYNTNIMNNPSGRPIPIGLSVPSSSGFGTLLGQGFGGLGSLDVRSAPSIPAKRVSTDGTNVMAEKAKMFLQNQSKNLSSDANDQNALLNLATFGAIAAPVSVLKGGLKRKHEGGGNPTDPSAAVKRPKMTVLWADENGGTLRDVMTFEVERIKNTIKDYKSHRDLVRKERQLEKDLHLSKTKEVMHPAIEWRRPDPLILSIDIRDNLEAPITSQEALIQTKRLTQVLETRYVDDTLIPGDPDQPVGPLSGTIGHEIVPIKLITWELPGEAAAQPAVNMVVVGSGQDADSSSSASSANDEFSQLISTLPVALRDLDRHFLQLIVQDEANVAFILNSVGEVDRSRIELLRQKLMPDASLPGNDRERDRDRDRERDRGNDRDRERDRDRDRNRERDRERGSDRDRDRDRHDRAGYYDPEHSQDFKGNGNGSYPPNFNWGRPGNGVQNSGPGSQDGFPPRDTDNRQQTGPGARKRSRFSGREDQPPPHTDGPGQGQGQGQGLFQDPMMPGHQPYRDQDSGPYIPFDRQGFDQPPDMDRDRRRDLPIDPALEKKFPTSKAAASCRFYNTRKGCQYGDKCSFGHFVEDATVPLDGVRGQGPGPVVPRDAPGPRDGPGWDGPGRDGPGRDGPGRDGFGRDVPPERRDGAGWDGPGREGPGRDGPGREGPGRDGPGREGAFYGRGGPQNGGGTRNSPANSRNDRDRGGRR